MWHEDRACTVQHLSHCRGGRTAIHILYSQEATRILRRHVRFKL